MPHRLKKDRALIYTILYIPGRSHMLPGVPGPSLGKYLGGPPKSAVTPSSMIPSNDVPPSFPSTNNLQKTNHLILLWVGKVNQSFTVQTGNLGTSHHTKVRSSEHLGKRYVKLNMFYLVDDRSY
jgi:hypothetical protein